MQNVITDASIISGHLDVIESFWRSLDAKASKKPTQYERYCAKNAPDCIRRFIQIGGGPKMGTTLEQYARHRFTVLQKRNSGKDQTGYDHIVTIPGGQVKLEQKSSGHWGDDDYKWQHVEGKHPWHMLLLCGIDYHEVKFWGMDRPTFARLATDGKITNQGNSTGESSEGVWFNYSDVKDSLTELHTNEELSAFVQRAYLATAGLAAHV